MDSPIRKTKQEDKKNIRIETRGGMAREVWDEIDEKGEIVKTAVWDILDRNGNAIGEQSWDELEEYIDALRTNAAIRKKKGRSKYTIEERNKRHAEAEQRREERARKNRNEAAAVLEYFLEEHPESFPQLPVYKLYPMMIKYISELGFDMDQRRFFAILTANQKFFESMGFTFGKGWSFLSRTQVSYIGYKSHAIVEDTRKKERRDEIIAQRLENIPDGEYSRMTLARMLDIKDITPSNLSWILARNSSKFGLMYSYDRDIFIKEDNNG